MASSSASDSLGPGGPLTGTLPDFVARPAQQQMAQCIEQTLADRGTLIVESGTGTGKTFAYLVPALLSGLKVIISTGTKHLQDQLFERDLPALTSALALSANRALLKGRSNYLCLHRLQINTCDNELPGFALDHIETIRAWAARTATGELSELSEVPEDAPVWPLVTSTNDNCIGSQCEHFEQCFVNKARRRAQAAQIVVVNHHLFCADLVLKQEGFGSLLPGVDAVVFDEAHQLPQIASVFLGSTITANQLRELCRDVRQEEKQAGSGVGGLLEAANGLEEAIGAFRGTLGEPGIKTDWDVLLSDPQVNRMLAMLVDALDRLAGVLEHAAPAAEGLSKCWARVLQFAGLLSDLQDSRGDDKIRWVETTTHGMSMHETPLHIGTALGGHLSAPDKAWIFTSATLSVGGTDFGHFADQIGVVDAQTESYPSPFDFTQQALMYIPEGLPDPRDSTYTEQAMAKIVPLLEANGGRAFLLFTSYRALHCAQRYLEERNRHRFNLLIQGSAPRARLLERFRSESRSVLLGTASFWEGVDVRGEALSLVVIDKLPFAAPDDPVLRARLRAIEAAGGNPFRDFQLPAAVLALKQGVGRLIRDPHDRGVLVLCDPRTLEKSYGRTFIKSLPPIPCTRELERAVEFIESSRTAKPQVSA